jgi:C-terminal processing protease CtpA/Prc
LILDVRKNFGGSDILSLAMASRLATSEYSAYAKVARMDPDDPSVFTEPQERTVPMTPRPSFGGPVAELIGRYTISAGETLTQALLGREPRITRIGENTQGVFSDVQGRSLPNGWSFGLPNELFLTEDGRSFDGPGIPPDIEVPVFRVADLEEGRDPALEAALAHLGTSEG